MAEGIDSLPSPTLTRGYQDYANFVDGGEALEKVMDRSGAKGTDQTFPVKLHCLLSDASEDGFSHILSWQPHGRSFFVHQHKEFVATVLPRCFRQSKFSSFQRQLNLYGFKRITTGRDKGSYYHELFLRSKPMLALMMQRTKVKGTGTRRPNTPELEPNFYLLPFLPTSNLSFTNPRPKETAPPNQPSSHPVVLEETTQQDFYVASPTTKAVEAPPQLSPYLNFSLPTNVLDEMLLQLRSVPQNQTFQQMEFLNQYSLPSYSLPSYSLPSYGGMNTCTCAIPVM